METLTESGEYDVQSLIFDEKELEGIPETEEFNLDTHIEGSGENTNVTMEYGDYVISFSPEIIEDEQNMEKATAGNVEVQEGIKTFSRETLINSAFLVQADSNFWYNRDIKKIGAVPHESVDNK